MDKNDYNKAYKKTSGGKELFDDDKKQLSSPSGFQLFLFVILVAIGLFALGYLMISLFG